MKKLFALIGLLIFLNFSFGQKFANNSTGLVILSKVWVDSVQLEIIFPLDFVLDLKLNPDTLDFEKNVLNYKQNQIIYLFDQNGLIGKFESNNFRIEQWCENDGGLQIIPKIVKTINRKVLLRRFPQQDNYGIVSFAIINPDNNLIPIDLKKLNLHLKHIGDFNKDGKIETILWMEYDDAQNCSNGLDSVIILRVNGKDYEMSCCGP